MNNENNPNFINATKENLQPCKGFGSANEPGRFIQPYNLKNEFPIFCDKVLAFGRHKNDPYTTMIPDSDFISTKGYISIKYFMLFEYFACIPSFVEY